MRRYRCRGVSSNHMKALKIAALLLALIMLSACWQGEEPEPSMLLPVVQEEPERLERTSVLPDHFSLPYAPGRTLDPITCADGIQQVAASLIYEGLFRLDAALSPQPCLCDHYDYDAEAFRYVFTLRSGVVFSDGTPLTGADVRATLERARTSERYRSRLSGVASVRAQDNTVIVTLSGPNTGFPALLDIPIVMSGTQDTAAPIGTGPYLYEDGYLVANQSWWRGDGQPVDRIVLVEASNQDAVLYRFSSHDVQLITADLTGASPVSTTGSVDCLDTASTVMQYLGCNTARAPLDNAGLRQALWAGVNRNYLVSAYLSGHGSAAQFPVSPASSLYPAELETEYSLEAFSIALTASGYVPERPLILLVNEENSFKRSIAGYLAESLTAAGLPLEVQVLPWEEYIAALEAGNFDLYYGEVRLSADWNLASLLNPGGTLNYGRWANEETSQLLAGFSASEDRTAAMSDLCVHLQKEAPIVPLCFKSSSVLTQADVVEGLQPTAAEPFYNLGQFTIHLKKE